MVKNQERHRRRQAHPNLPRRLRAGLRCSIDPARCCDSCGLRPPSTVRRLVPYRSWPGERTAVVCVLARGQVRQRAVDHSQDSGSKPGASQSCEKDPILSKKGSNDKLSPRCDLQYRSVGQAVQCYHLISTFSQINCTSI